MEHRNRIGIHIYVKQGIGKHGNFVEMIVWNGRKKNIGKKERGQGGCLFSYFSPIESPV